MWNNNPTVHGENSNKRIWSLYNESLVRRMKDILDLKDMENYWHELKKQNMKKNGRPFILPDKIIEILARIRAVFNASFRSLESYMRIFQEILGIPRISYSSIFRRIRKIIGTFRSESGSQNYQYIASLLSTWRLQGRSMFVEMDKILRRELCGFG